MKFTRKLGESMFLIANCASVGMCVLCLIFSSARSFNELSTPFEIGGDLLRGRDHASAVTRDGFQHVTALDINAVSPRLW